MKKISLILVSFFAALLFAQSNSIDPIKSAFHFDAYKLNKNSQISAARLNHPITEADRIAVSKDGHLEASGERLRIWGTNLSEFPRTHEEADFFAKALADQGYNCIRFHHTDASWTNCFLKKNAAGKWVIDNKRFDDFDYFFLKLKENGIYSDINFLTGRSISSKDGYKSEVDSFSDWKTAHILGIWDEDALKKQKEYASSLLTHVNPYTGIAYKDDPAVAIVEINNENGLLMGYTNRLLEDVTGYYWRELEEQWNQWLAANGFTYEGLSSKYNQNEKIKNQVLAPGTEGRLEQHSGSKATLTKNGKQTAIKVEKNGTDSWHVQYNFPNLSMSSDKIYTIKFSAKASKEAEIDVALMQAHDPWKNAGFSSPVKLKSEWSDFEYVVEDIDTDNNLRLNLGSMGKSAGTTFYFKNISISEGGNIENVKLSRNNPESVALPHFAEYSTMPEELKNLVMTFLWEKEEAYWLSMIDFVRNSIKSNALIMGTAAGCSTTYLQSHFDIIDSHSYWNHPSFTEKSWDVNHYYVNNKDLTKAGYDSTLISLAKYRVYGKPFSVSEYDHPYPNQFLSQDYPMISSFGSFQDWDCIFTFCSEIPKTEDGKHAKINGYFDQSNNPAKACASPIAARIFRMGLVSPAYTKIAVSLTKEKELSKLSKMHAWSLGNPELFGSIPQVALKYQLGINLKDVTPETIVTESVSYINKADFPDHFVGFDETKQIYWNEVSGTYIVCNPNVSISVMSNDSVYPEIPEEWNNFDLMPAKPAKTADFIVVAAAKDYSDKNEPYLIFSCSWVGNTNDHLTEYGKGFKTKRIYRDPIKLTTLSSLGTSPVLALGSDAYLYVDEKSEKELYKTEIEGNKAVRIPLTKADESKAYNLHKDDKTLWYVLE